MRPAEDPIALLFAAVVRNAMEDLGCTGRLGGTPIRRSNEHPAAARNRFMRAARFINSDEFVRYCRAAGFDPELWRVSAWRQLRVAAAYRLRPARKPEPVLKSCA